MMYSNARYGNFKQGGIKNRGHFENLELDYEVPAYEEVHFLSADELMAPPKLKKPKQAK